MVCPAYYISDPQCVDEPMWALRVFYVPVSYTYLYLIRGMVVYGAKVNQFGRQPLFRAPQRPVPNQFRQHSWCRLRCECGNSSTYSSTLLSLHELLSLDRSFVSAVGTQCITYCDSQEQKQSSLPLSSTFVLDYASFSTWQAYNRACSEHIGLYVVVCILSCSDVYQHHAVSLLVID